MPKAIHLPGEVSTGAKEETMRDINEREVITCFMHKMKGGGAMISYSHHSPAELGGRKRCIFIN